ncbi:phosphohistidine phosphatase [Actinoplanes tereljensis]|uniref:Phosphoglycerate/bisphosphoglycerate mutase n=1 Tax=Paractinoplanes tereljensis TaxID=571912 RepID=A0A919TVI3_9ACTN|nr:histidine phosphatase family protein [Actinoplanes tereljensis]GIF24843.1 putative phosphoglycerate/bisphosphoglycerate mutase [Actinoplanes tereljensis]
MSARTLVILRHAKAETPGEEPDFDRKLTTRGETDADAAGAWLADERIHPDLVFCSPAARTRQTWQGVSIALAQAQTGQVSAEVRYEKSLYEGGRTEVFDLLQTVPDTVRTVLVVGHNPTVSEVSILLVPDEQWDGRQVELRTSGLAVHRADGPWAATEPGSMPLTERHTARG